MINSFYERLKTNLIRIKEIIRIIDLKQIIDIFIFPLIALISIIFKPFCRNIWIIEENPNEACDNGYVLFTYLRNNQKDINAYYVINKKSKDYEKVKKYGNIISHGSMKHWIYYLNSSKIIVTQKYANPSWAIFYLLHTKRILKTPRIFLQHGITKDDGKLYYYNRTNFRLFICGAKREFDFIKERFGYPDENVVYTGFARFDVFDTDRCNKNDTILIAPTWRKWISSQKEFDDFLQKYMDIVNDTELITFLEKYNIKIKIVLHKNMKKYKFEEQKSSKNISINHNDEVDIQDLINNTSLLVTDYSSISFDVAYIKRPIIYYQFDYEKYRKMQLQEGYFSYENDGFGEIVKDKKLVVKKIIEFIKNDFQIENTYSKRMDDFFELKDKNNCQRIYEEIKKT